MGRPILHRPLFLVRPPPDVAALLGRVRDAAGPVGKPVPDDRLHITIVAFHDYPDFPDEIVERARSIAAAARPVPFRVVFDRLIAGAHSALLVPSEPVRGIEAFQQRLSVALIGGGLNVRSGWRFHPHITLRHGAQPGLDRPIDPISWTVEDLVLVDSVVGTGRHDVLARWSLRD